MGVTVAVTRVACNTSTGTQDITTSDLGDLTPKAAIFIVTEATSDGTAATHAVLGIGAADGTNQWAVGGMSEDGQSSTQSGRRAMTDECVLIMTVGGLSVDGEAAFDSWLTNGVRINWGDAPSSAFLLTVVFFAGTDLSVGVDTFTFASTINTATDVTSVGFEADAVLFACHAEAFDDNGHSSLFHSFGVATNGESVTQYSAATHDRHAQSTTIQEGLTSDDYAISLLYNGTNYLAGEIGSFDSDGFSCTTRIHGGSGEQVGYLALEFNSAVEFKAGVVSTPTSTGSDSVTDPGFKPQAVLLGLSRCATLDTVETDQLDAGVFGISVFDEDDEYCNSIQCEDGQSTSDTQSLSDDTVINLPEGDGTAGHVAAFTSFDTNGWTWNFSTTDTGSARQWWYFAIEEDISVVEGTASASASGAASAQALNFAIAQATMSGSGAQSASALNFAIAGASLSGSGALSGAPLLIIPGVSALSGEGALSISALNLALGQASLAGSSGLSAAPSLFVLGQAALAGSGGLSAAAMVRILAQASLSGSGGVSGAAALTVVAQAAVSGSGGLSGAALNFVLGQGSLAGSGGLSGIGEILLGIVQGTAALSGAGDLSASALLQIPGAAALSGSGALSGAPLLIIPGVSALSGAGALSAQGVRFALGQAALSGTGDLSGMALLIIPAQSTLSGSGSLGGIGSVYGTIILGIVLMSGTGTLGAVATMFSTPTWREYELSNGNRQYTPSSNRVSSVEAKN